MWKIIKLWFYYTFKENYIKDFIKFDEYYVCKMISENDLLEDDTKTDVLEFYGIQYNKEGD